MIVAFRATHGRSQPHHAQGTDPIGAIFGQIFFGLQTAFGRGAIQAIVSGRDLLIGSGVGNQITGELLAREHVERLVIAKSAQHM